MLLSMYASYHWARGKNYVHNIGFFILLISFLSSLFPIGTLLFFTFPFPFLSFPLYAYIDPIFIEGLGWVDFLGIRFFSIGSAYPLPTGLENIFLLFLLFLFVNLIGARLGYEASRVRRIREWGTTKTWSFLGFILAIAFIGVGYWLGSSIPPITKSDKEVIYGFGRGPYGFDGWALFFYGIIVLAIVIGKILWRHWDQLLEKLP